MPRPRKDQTLQPVSLRLPEALIGQVDACAKRLQDELPLLEVNRTDALRYLIQLGLEAEAKGGKKKRK